MVIKRKSLNSPKNHGKKNTNHRSQKLLFLNSIGILIVLILVIFVTVYFYTRSKKPKPKFTIQYSAIEETNSVSKEHMLAYEIINLNESSQADEMEQINTQIAIFEDIISYLFNKLYKNYNKDFTNKLKTFAEAHYKPSVKSYEKIEEISVLISNKIETQRYKPGLSIFGRIKHYYMVIYHFSQIIYIAYESFDTNELAMILYDEKSNSDSYYNEKFIYQQLHLNLILTNTIEIVNAFKEAIVNILSAQIEREHFIELTSAVINKLERIKTKMFVDFNGWFQLDVEESAHVEYILHYIEYYERFLILNYYIIFIHLFEVNENFEVIEINQLLLEQIWIIGDHDHFSTFKDYVRNVIAACKDIFLFIAVTKKEDDFLNIDKQIFNSCKSAFQLE